LNGVEQGTRRAPVRCAWLGIALAVGLPAAATPSNASTEEAAFAVRLRARLLVGELDGFAQTPQGGSAASTSARRPEFDELGIDAVVGGDFELGLGWRAWRLDAGARFLRADTRSTLEVALVSQGASFPAGSRVRSQLQLDVYRVGIGRAFELTADGVFGLPLVVTPGVESVLLDFEHRIEGALAGQRTHREYTRLGARIALGHPDLNLELVGFWGLPIGTLAEVSTFEAIASYQLPTAWRIRTLLQLGLLYEHIDFADSQSTPNRIEADYGPALTAGVALAF
jgi:hypothetical protein